MILEYDSIVVGSSLKAVLFAYTRQFPLIFTKASAPFRFDYVAPDIAEGCVKLWPVPLSSATLTTGEEISLGYPKHMLWETLIYLLSLQGNLPLSNLAHGLRYDGKTIVCSNAYSKIAEMRFKECYYFDDKQATGFVNKKEVEDGPYVCYDWIAFHRGGKHEVDFIATADEFVKEIWFYPSDRIDGNTGVKDACVVSHLTEDQIRDFDYSETMARFKMISEMESRGMKGLFNGYSPTGRPKYYRFNTSHIRRERMEQLEPTHTPAAPNIYIPFETEHTLFEDLSTRGVDIDRFLRYL
jgi:hypothetical protein